MLPSTDLLCSNPLSQPPNSGTDTLVLICAGHLLVLDGHRRHLARYPRLDACKQQRPAIFRHEQPPGILFTNAAVLCKWNGKRVGDPLLDDRQLVSRLSSLLTALVVVLFRSFEPDLNNRQNQRIENKCLQSELKPLGKARSLQRACEIVCPINHDEGALLLGIVETLHAVGFLGLPCQEGLELLGPIEWVQERSPLLGKERLG
mmetsp:Transcript_45907/g.111825  ORF Transcript_45907/g.111825 Transcript_45907/m.111825 type:complete len:204 (-) Transcript_45907:483-1094(-)